MFRVPQFYRRPPEILEIILSRAHISVEVSDCLFLACDKVDEKYREIQQEPFENTCKGHTTVAE